MSKTTIARPFEGLSNDVIIFLPLIFYEIIAGFVRNPLIKLSRFFAPGDLNFDLVKEYFNIFV